MAIRAILFDLDGTLVDSERESAEAMARALERGHGIVIDQAARDFIIGRSWVEIYRNLTERYGVTWSRAHLIRETARERVGVFADQGITILPGAVETVHRFESLRRALVTGSSREEAGQVLDALDLRACFEVVVCAEDVPSSKPEPDGYNSAARQLGVETSDCVVVEDSHAGIAAGRAAGAHVVAVRAGNFHGQDQSAAHLIIETLDELTHDLVAGLVR